MLRPLPRPLWCYPLVADQMSVLPKVAGQSASGQGAGRASSQLSGGPRLLVLHRRWSPERYRDWLPGALARELLPG